MVDVMRETLELDDREAREQEWSGSTGTRYRWLADAGWWRWAGRQWEFAGWLVHLDGPFEAVPEHDELGPDAGHPEFDPYGFE